MRKFIQIAACGVTENHCTQCDAYFVATADDGTTWMRTDKDGNWYPLGECPQQISRYDEMERALQAVYDEVEGIEDGAPDSGAEALLANKIFGIVRPFNGRRNL